MFSGSYVDAKNKFVMSALESGYRHSKYIMPEIKGPGGEELSTDVAFHVTAKTKKILIVNSGIHGVEGFYGSAMQSLWLTKHKASDLPEELGIVFIHASNPYGFAYLERVDQSHIDKSGCYHRVDPNRNFIDFSEPLPINPGYTQTFEDLLIPSDWYGCESYFATASLLFKLLQDKIQNTSANFISPMMGGQYWSAAGFSYGGNHPSWANIVIKKIMSEIVELSYVIEIVFIDLHTGVGQRGQAEAYSGVTEDNENHIRAKGWLQGIINTVSSPYNVTGAAVSWMLDFFSKKKITSFAVECGTEAPLQVVNSLRAQNWLDKYGDPSHQHEAEIKRDIKSAFYPEDDAWKSSVTDVTMNILQRVIEKLVEDKKYKNKFKQAVFSSGGPRGTGYPGCHRALLKTGILNEIEHLNASSAGSILSAFIAVGVPSQTMYEIFLQTNFFELLGDKTGSWVGGNGLGRNPLTRDGIPLLIKTREIINTAVKDFLENQDQSKFSNKVKIIYESFMKEEHPCLTFKDLEDLREFFPHKKIKCLCHSASKG